MTEQLSPDIVAWWCSPEGQEVVGAVAQLSWEPAEALASTSRLREQFPALDPDKRNAAIDLVAARAAAVRKLGPHTADWLLTTEAVQQATSQPVLEHRTRSLAVRMAESGVITGVHDATCSIGTELASLKASFQHVSGSDLSPARVAMARHNLPGVELSVLDALAPTWANDVVTIVDPARRVTGGNRRYQGPDATIPSLRELLDVYSGRPYVIKYAPGIDWEELFHDAWGGGAWHGEVSLVSVLGSSRGGVKEATLWSPELSTPGVRRRATVLHRDGSVAIDISSDLPALAPIHHTNIKEPGEFLIDPDGAIVRAGLVQEWAEEHGLWLLDPRIAHLSADVVPAGIPHYRVLSQHKMRPGEIKRALRENPASALEIVVRGVEVNPSQLRKAVFPRPTPGAPAKTLFITRIGSSAVAFLCSSLQVG